LFKNARIVAGRFETSHPASNQTRPHLLDAFCLSQHLAAGKQSFSDDIIPLTILSNCDTSSRVKGEMTGLSPGKEARTPPGSRFWRVLAPHPPPGGVALNCAGLRRIGFYGAENFHFCWGHLRAT
jgi:hypothetical protein